MGCKPETWKEGEGGGKRNGKRAHSVSSCLVLDSVSCFPGRVGDLLVLCFFMHINQCLRKTFLNG